MERLPFNEGVAVVEHGTSFYFIDRRGVRVAGFPALLGAAFFEEGHALVFLAANKNTALHRRRALLRRDGQIVLDPADGWLVRGGMSRGLVPAALLGSDGKPEKVGYVDGKGRFKIVLPLDAKPRAFYGSLARVGFRDGWGYVNERGDIVWRCKR